MTVEATTPPTRWQNVIILEPAPIRCQQQGFKSGIATKGSAYPRSPAIRIRAVTRHLNPCIPHLSRGIDLSDYRACMIMLPASFDVP